MLTRDRKIISIDDKQAKNFDDKVECQVNSSDDGSAKPRKGFVSIIDKDSGEFLIKDKPCDFGGTGKNNLIVWQGREIIPQIIFDKDRDLNSGQKDLNVRWLSLGTGGADAINVLDPIAPTSQNFALVNEIVIDAANPLYTDAKKKKPFDSIAFEQDAENENRYLVAKLTTTILYAEANGNDLNEAALWFSNSADPLASNVFQMFARVTFSTIRKHENRELIILWYIYF